MAVGCLQLSVMRLSNYLTLPLSLSFFCSFLFLCLCFNIFCIGGFGGFCLCVWFLLLFVFGLFYCLTLNAFPLIPVIAVLQSVGT